MLPPWRKDTALSRLPEATIAMTGQGLLDIRGDGTFTYTPGFTVNIKILDVAATGAWAGAMTGDWSLAGDVLTMTETSNNIGGSLTVFGRDMPLPAIRPFNGTGRVARCTPETLELQLDTPVGQTGYTLVLGP